MMKKIFSTIAVVTAVLFAGNASAGNFNGPGATTLSPAAGAAQSCIVLSNDVSIQLSAGVFAGYTCTDTDFSAATCHQTGTNKSQTVSCTYTAVPGTDPVQYEKSDDQCPDYDPNAAQQASSATFIGRIAFRGASGGGTVSAVNLRGNTCDGATVEALTQ